MFIPSSVLRKKKQNLKNNSNEKLTKKKNNLSNSIYNNEIETNSNKNNLIINNQSNSTFHDTSKSNIISNDKTILNNNNNNNNNKDSTLLTSNNISTKENEIKKINEEFVEEDKVKEYSFQQRWPLDDNEPICIICGRYGEYICDETDHDVCSMECKKLDIQNAKISKEESSYLSNTNLFSNNNLTDIPIALDTITFPIQKMLFNSDLLINSIDLKEFLEKKFIDIKIPEELDIPNPIQKFESLNLNSQLFQNLKKNRYYKPTPIQMLSIPLLLSGNDMLVKSPMKSGKTLAYLLPLIINCINMAQCFLELDGISNNYNNKITTNIELQNFKNYSTLNKNFGPYAIILTPSKELCIQLESLCKKLLQGIPYMKTALLIGGVPYPNQFYRLCSGVQIVIATPSRLLEILKKSENDSDELEFDSKKKRKKLKRNYNNNNNNNNNKKDSTSVNYLSWDLVSFLVIDEIDQMINYGEEETLHNILDRLKIINRSNHYNQTAVVTSNENNYIQLNKNKKNNNRNLIHSLQISLFSSTIPQKIVSICKKFLNSSFITVSVKDETEIASSLSETLHLTSNSNTNSVLNSETNIVSNSNYSIQPSVSVSASASASPSPSLSPSILNENNKPVIPNLVYPRPLMNVNNPNPIISNPSLSHSSSLDSTQNISKIDINIRPRPVLSQVLPISSSSSTFSSPSPSLSPSPSPSPSISRSTSNSIANELPPGLSIPPNPRPLIPSNRTSINSNSNLPSLPLPTMPMIRPLPPPPPLLQNIQRPISISRLSPYPSSSSFIRPKLSSSSSSSFSSSSSSQKPVKQTFLWVEDNSKKKELFKLLMDSRYFQPLIIIFVDSRLGAELLTKAIQKKTGLGVACVHGQKSVEERAKILEQFKLGGPYPIIVSTTGILSRGIQLEDVRMVIQFDCASSVEDYMHQVGRCAIPVASTNSFSSFSSSSSSSSSQLTRKAASFYFPKGNKHFRTGHPWLGGTGGWAITFINKTNQSLMQKLYHQYLKNLSSSELTPLPSQFLQHIKK